LKPTVAGELVRVSVARNRADGDATRSAYTHFRQTGERESLERQHFALARLVRQLSHVDPGRGHRGYRHAVAEEKYHVLGQSVLSLRVQLPAQQIVSDVAPKRLVCKDGHVLLSRNKARSRRQAWRGCETEDGDLTRSPIPQLRRFAIVEKEKGRRERRFSDGLSMGIDT